MGRLLSSLALLIVASCGVDVSSESGPGFDEMLDVDLLSSTLTMDDPAHSDICGALPADGACSLLCDVDMLVANFVPEGTCVAFICDLNDGQTIAMHVCHPP